MTKIEELCNVYYNLPADNQPLSGDVRLLADTLEEICTEDAAQAALYCSNMPQTCQQIAAAARVDQDYLEPLLKESAQVGVLMVCYNAAKEVMYYQAPLYPGLAENLVLRTPTEKASLWYEQHCDKITEGIYPNLELGRGLLRAIPVKESVKAESKIYTYDELIPFIENATDISVADCACRTAARVLGHGCEHTHKEVCIQTDQNAQSYILTGRGRRISKEEAYDILKEAEIEGLVHQVGTGDPNKSAFICNCCGCNCVTLKAANLMNLSDGNRSNFVAEVDAQNCVGCGACVEACNTNALALGTCLANEAPKLLDRPDPAVTDWTEDLWDKDYLVRKMVNEQGTAPCKTFCPAHISVQGYIKKASEGNFIEALKVIKRENPFPAVCGRICPHNCEDECTRSLLDESIAIDDIKKYIADKELNAEIRYIPEIRKHYNYRVAVVGSGPAGLSCAYYLASYGFKVTVFEKDEILGGMLSLGIPSFRLEKEVINSEIDVLRELGVKFRTGVEVGKDITLKEMRENGFNAFYLAIGAQNSRKLGIEGEDAKGVRFGIDFLRSVNLGKDHDLIGTTVVIGGGNVAIDVARSAIRVGSDDTRIFCLEQQEEMPALLEEQEEAEAEGVKIINGWGPSRIITKDGKVAGVEFKRCTSAFDKDGRFAPVYDDQDLITVECDNVIISIGQSIDWKAIRDDSNLEVTERNTLVVDSVTLQAGDEDVFAGGDAITGPKFAIDAIAAGKMGAVSIQRYLQGNSLTMRREREYRPLDKENLKLEGYDRMARQRIAKPDALNSRKSLNDVRTALTDEQLKKETSRCLSCGITVVDLEKCIGCGICSTKCEFDAIHLVRRYDIKPSANMGEYFQRMNDHTKTRMEKIEQQKTQGTV